ncbi:MAG: hypothetical protein Q9O24_01920 [Gammaproteobacteria bacterium]|nr:hypothetical protein [Gammaproteobacteria bacterium]
MTEVYHVKKRRPIWFWALCLILLSWIVMGVAANERLQSSSINVDHGVADMHSKGYIKP